MKRYFSMLVLSASFTLSATAFAQDRDHDRQSQRYEDKAHKDYHEWNDREDQAYRHYLQEHHKKYHNFSKASKREQNDYWKWRHSHPDEDHR